MREKRDGVRWWDTGHATQVNINASSSLPLSLSLSSSLSLSLSLSLALFLILYPDLTLLSSDSFALEVE